MQAQPPIVDSLRAPIRVQLVRRRDPLSEAGGHRIADASSADDTC